MATRRIEAEITFSGLCFIRLGRPEPWDLAKTRGPALVDRVDVLLVDTFPERQAVPVEGTREGDPLTHCHDPAGEENHGHIHYPRLTYYAEDHLALAAGSLPEASELLPSPEGREVVSIDLCRRQVEVIPPFDYRAEWPFAELRWCPLEGNSVHATPPERCVDWVLGSEQIQLGTVEETAAITTVAVPNGIWETHGVYLNREVASLNPVRWRVGSAPEQPIARDVVLRLPQLRHGPTLRIWHRDRPAAAPYDIVLTPGIDSQLRFAISNLPTTASGSDESHLGMFRSLAPSGGPIVEPVQQDDVVCVNVACDVVQG